MFIVISASCYAAPVPDYSFGHLKLNIDTGFSSFSPDYTDSQIGYGASLTAGLGGFAGQYSYSKYNSSNLKNHQINFYDHILGPVGVFVGASQTVAAGAGPQNGIVFGVAGAVPIAPRTSAYAILSGGNHVSGREFGLGYELGKDAELGLFYRNTKFAGLKLANGDNGDAAFEGFYSGISIKL